MKKLAYCNIINFFDTDKTVLQYLTDEYEIYWYPIIQANNTSKKYNFYELKLYAEKHKIKFNPIYIPCRFRSLMNIKYYYLLLKQITGNNPDILFTSTNIIYWHVIFLLFFFKWRKIVIKGIHDVELHSNTKYSWINNFINYISAFFYRKCITYSKSQNEIFKIKFRKDAFCVGMSTKDFGISKINRQSISKGVKLLFFGGISEYKGLDNLIQVIEDLKINGISNLHLSIYGKGDFWNNCSNLIRTPELYNLNIRFIENSEIPDLMSSHHFLVLPYRNVTNSGPMMIALNYGLPIIAPNMGCFNDVYNSESALLYEKGQLYNILETVSHIDDLEYKKMTSACKKLSFEYSPIVISKRYKLLFTEICSNKYLNHN